MVTQGQRIRESMGHKPHRTHPRPRIDPGNLPPSSSELQARRARYWSEIMGNAVSLEMHHS